MLHCPNAAHACIQPELGLAQQIVCDGMANKTDVHCSDLAVSQQQEEICHIQQGMKQPGRKLDCRFVSCKLGR